MNKSRLIGTLSAAVFSFITLPSHAVLLSLLDGQAVYDVDRNISWVSNANLALTNQFGLTLGANEFEFSTNTVGSTGRMTWDNAVAWIADMNTANYLGFNNWRLPDVPQPDPTCSDQALLGVALLPVSFGTGCTGSEMGHLYNDEGVTTAAPGPYFTNLHPTPGEVDPDSADYWSSKQLPLLTAAPLAWVFNFGNGIQNLEDEGFPLYALAVHDGNIGAVPIPAAVWLFGSGLIGLVGITRKRKAT